MKSSRSDLKKRFQDLDHAVIDWIQYHRGDLRTQFFRALTITAWGGCWGLLVIGIFCANYFDVLPDFNRLMERTLRALVAPGLTWIFVSLVKAKWKRQRPFHHYPEQPPLTWTFSKKDDSFPSGHAASAFAFLFACLFILGLKAPIIFLPAVATWAVLVSYSRIYLGVHYLSDVLAGALIGSIVGIIIGVALA